MDFSFSELNYNSVETLPGFEVRAAFTVNSSSVFKEDVGIVPSIVDDSLSYIPWGGDNQMPFDLLALIEKDETLATCQCFNPEGCYGSGLQYCATEASASVKSAVDDFLIDNDLAAYFLGICQDLKHFGFAVSVLILNAQKSKCRKFAIVIMARCSGAQLRIFQRMASVVYRSALCCAKEPRSCLRRRYSAIRRTNHIPLNPICLSQKNLVILQHDNNLNRCHDTF